MITTSHVTRHADASLSLSCQCRDETHPLSFGRDVLAKLADVPERSDWKKCKMASAKAEEDAAKAFQAMYMPFVTDN